MIRVQSGRERVLTIGGFDAIRVLSSSVPFSPLSISGLKLWLDASDSATLFQDSGLTTPAVADADPVGGWTDKSGNANHVTQATAGKRPTLKLAIQNGLPVVRGDGSDDSLSGAVTANAARTVFVVAKKRSAPGAATKTLISYGITNFMSVHTDTDFSTAYRYGVSLNNWGTPTSWTVITLSYASLSSCTIYSNGTAVAAPFDPNDNYAGGTNWQLFTIVGSDPGDFDIAEVLGYDVQLSSPNQALVESYLNSKWVLF